MENPLAFLENYIANVKDEREKNFLTHRLMGQMDYYAKKSSENKQKYQNNKVRIIFLSSLIPVAVGYADSPFGIFSWGEGNSFTMGHLIKLIVGFAGAFVAIWESIAVFKKYRENWVEYRLTHEMLQAEAWLYVTATGVYAAQGNRFDQLVQNVEGILAKENTGWKSVVNDGKTDK
jgi:Protein of unknown function (DUF4231)